MNAPTIYLDNNATTELDLRVAAVMADQFQERLANPASQHAAGRRSRSVLESARQTIAEGLGCRTHGMQADQIVFTSGGTEANNLAIFGLLEGLVGDLVVSSIEHPSVLAAAEIVEQKKTRRVRMLPVDSLGRACQKTWDVWLDQHRKACRSQQSEGRIAMVSVMVANNETGVLQPLKQIVESARGEGITTHSDAVQAIGKVSFGFESMQLDAMTVSAHKLHGPVGVGALVLRNSIKLHPIQFGGFQQLGLRPGTESVPLAVGFAKAIEISTSGIDARARQMSQLREKLEAMLLENQRSPVIVACDANRLPHTIALAYAGIERQALQMAMDREGVFCSTGSACASGSGQPSHVLKAMQVPDAVLRGAIRLSLSVNTTLPEVVEAANRISRIVNRFPG
ncbi:MAG: cysteine desulfurase family protein [Pirellulaceae bacterium]|nr:cysteine desulfurase family protein [Pirellulaceae bacterium]